jgi:hypothetical protein
MVVYHGTLLANIMVVYHAHTRRYHFGMYGTRVRTRVPWYQIWYHNGSYRTIGMMECMPPSPLVTELGRLLYHKLSTKAKEKHGTRVLEYQKWYQPGSVCTRVRTRVRTWYHGTIWYVRTRVRTCVVVYHGTSGTMVLARVRTRVPHGTRVPLVWYVRTWYVVRTYVRQYVHVYVPWYSSTYQWYGIPMVLATVVAS